jgi:hypothetical protein
VANANAYIEALPKGHAEGSPIEGFVAEDHVSRVRGTFKTQQEAIDWAKSRGYVPHVVRVRHLNDKTKLGHWREV